MIEDQLEHLDPVAYLTASDADRVGQFFVRDRCFCRLVGHGGRLPVAKAPSSVGSGEEILAQKAPALIRPWRSASYPLLVGAQLFNASGLPGGAVVAQRGSVGIGQGGSGWSDAGRRAACHRIFAEELSYRRFVLCLRH
jgi:hypothetical protein